MTVKRGYAPRDVTKGVKTQAVRIALDPVTRTKFEIAARRSNVSLAHYVTKAAQDRLEAEDRDDPAPMFMPNGERLTMHRLACCITADTESRQFMRMAFMAPHLMRVMERIRYARILQTKEFWLRDPRKYPPLEQDFSEPKRPVVNYALLEEKWAELLQSESDKDSEADRVLKPLRDQVRLWQGTKPTGNSKG